MLLIVDQELHQRGLNKLDEMGTNAQSAIKTDLARISPDMARYAIETTCGDIYSRPGLEVKTREMVAVAALTVLGSALPQLKIHVEAGLNIGCTKNEIEEIIIQMSVYAGWPAAFNAMAAAHEVFETHHNQQSV